MNDFHQFRDKVRELVKAWKKIIKPHIEESGKYGESNTRKHLIDPILNALNWVDDGSKKIVDNEFAVKHRTGTGSADYALKVHGAPKILVEAKDAAKVKDLENDYDTIHGIKRTYPRQLSNYCHDLNLQKFDIKFAILTNGREWILYNLQYADISSEREIVFRIDIEEMDKTENLLKLWALEYNDFCKGYQRLREIIQDLHDSRLDIDREAVQQLLKCKDLLSISILNDYDNNIRGIKKQIDDILENKEKVNGIPLFQDIPKKDRLSLFIKEASSSIINKILFIRILEDKNFLTPKLTKRSIEKWKDFWGYKDYTKIMVLFREASKFTEDTYNGGLFEIKPHDKVDYDPNIIKKIIDTLGEIKFRNIDSDIIGRIYEIYLGQVLKVESKIKGKKRTKYQADNKERKKLGQYYTPKFVVDFIVKNTLGKLIEGKKPEDVSKIRILDPACGSGSFLINAYDALAEHYEKWNSAILKKINEDNRKNGANLVKYQNNGIIPNYKNLILKENIHGVDLNDLSVQIAEINLWLRALERDKKLIKLNKNILHGNSLITGVEGREELAHYNGELEEIKRRTSEIKDYYDKDELTREEKKRLEALELKLNSLKGKINSKLNENLKDYFDDHISTIHPFNWEVEFPSVMQEGGFDVVIGNPPYIRPHKIPIETKKYFWKYFEVFKQKSDIYNCFIQRGIDLAAEGGIISYIVSSTWLSLQSFKELRKYMLDNCRIINLVILPKKVFQDATVETIIFIFEKNSNKKERKSNDISIIKYFEHENEFKEIKKIPQIEFVNEQNYAFTLKWTKSYSQIISKINKESILLGKIADIRNGIATGDDPKFIINKKEGKEDKKVLYGEDVNRYSIDYKGLYIRYLPEEMIKHRKTARPASPDWFDIPEKILIHQVGGAKIKAYLDVEQYYSTISTIVLRPLDTRYNLKFILALLNSRLIKYWYKNQSVTSTVKVDELRNIPIPLIKINEKKTYYNGLIDLSDRISCLNKNLSQILKCINQALSNQPLKDPKSCKFAHYFDNYGLYHMQRETSNKINEIKAKILSLKVREEGDKLVIYMTNYNEEQKHTWKDIRAVTLTIEDGDIRKFLFYSISKYINNKGGKGFGRGNLLELIKRIEVPVYVSNIKMNTAKIKEIMKEFNSNTKEMWWKDESKKEKFASLTEMENEIRKTDMKIDEMVYKLYGITEDEKKIIEQNLK